MPNMTMKLNVKPSSQRNSKAIRNDTGMAVPTITPLRGPMAATTRTMTSTRGGDDVALQFRHLGSGKGRLVLGVGEVESAGQPWAELFDDLPDRVDGVHHVGVLALVDVERDRLVAVDACIPLAILERPTDGSHVGEGDHRVAVHLHGQVSEVVGGLDESGNLHRHAAGTGVQGSGCDEPVVADHGSDEFFGGDLVRLECGRVDHDLEELFPVSLQLRGEDRGQRLDGIAKISGRDRTRPAPTRPLHARQPG